MAVLLEQGDLHTARSEHADALVIYEHAFACKPHGSLVIRAYVAACNAGNASSAKQWFAQIDPAHASQLAPICARNGIQVP